MYNVYTYNLKLSKMKLNEKILFRLDSLGDNLLIR